MPLHIGYDSSIYGHVITDHAPPLQDSQLYYDAGLGTYYYYDPETRQYQIHSKVKIPKKVEPESDQRDSEDVIDLCSSEEEMFEGKLQNNRPCSNVTRV